LPGAGDRIARLPWRVDSPLGQPLTTLTLPGELCATLDETRAEVTHFDATRERIEFDFGGQRWRYDRLGLRGN